MGTGYYMVNLSKNYVDTIDILYITYQWVFFWFSLSRLLAWTALLRYIVPVEPYVLWPKSQQGMPLVLLWTCNPREALHHPLRRVLPCCLTPIHLQNKQIILCLFALASQYCNDGHMMEGTLPAALLWQPPACRGWWSSSTDRWTTLSSLQHPLGRTKRVEVLWWTKYVLHESIY